MTSYFFDPTQTGMEHLRAIMSLDVQPGISATLSMRLTHAEEGFVIFEATPDTRFYNLVGSAHGGYIATLLDSACGGATHSRLAAGQTYITLDLNTSYHRPVTIENGPIRAEGRILSFGRRISYTEAKLFGRGNKLLASATSTLLVSTI
jgi:uncharacterized protein (TIGR00369 family)